MCLPRTEHLMLGDSRKDPQSFLSRERGDGPHTAMSSHRNAEILWGTLRRLL